MRFLLVLALALAACSKDEPVVEVTGKSSATDIVKGTLSVDGQPVTLGACKPGHATRVFVDLVTSKGKLRFQDQLLFWNPSVDSPDRGSQLDCEKLDRSWGGGVRIPGDGSAYWRGKLWFECGRVAGELELDCGGITETERAQLDGKRQELQDDQRR